MDENRGVIPGFSFQFGPLFGRYFGLTGAERSGAEKNKETEKPVISRGTGDRKRSGKKSGHFRLPSAAPAQKPRKPLK